MELTVEGAGASLPGSLTVPDKPAGIVLFAHGSGSSRFSPRNQAVAGHLNAAGFGTLLFDLLTADEERLDSRTGELRFDVALLAGRLIAAIDWLDGQEQARGLPRGLFGASTGAAAALMAAAARSAQVRAVVSRGGRPDLANAALGAVRAPVLLIVGGLDTQVRALNEATLAGLPAGSELEVVPGATHLFGEPGALEQVAALAERWFARNLALPRPRLGLALPGPRLGRGAKAQNRSKVSKIVDSCPMDRFDRGVALAGAIAPLSDVSTWARGNLLVIILLILGAILLTRLADWARGRIMTRIDARAAETEELVRSEAAKHRHVVAQVLTWCILAVIYVVTAVLAVQRLGVPLAGLVAPAALISAAVGFGLQKFVQDIGAGFFITGEHQYGFGDVVRISVTGVPEPAIGTVEEVTLRVTRVRSEGGEVIITPNGQIVQVTNLSRDWARAVIDVPVPSSVDVGHATEVLQRVGRDAYGEDRLRKKMLDEPTVMGVERIEVDAFSLRMVARTLPGMQFDVGRVMRARVARAFRSEGIIVSAELDTGHPTGNA